MRVIAIIVAILGLAVFVYGILFVAQAGTAEKEIATSVAPLTLDQVNGKYNEMDTQVKQLQSAQGAQIQAGNPSVQYLMISGQRTSLGLAKSNIGTAKFVRTSGTVAIMLGLGLFLSGIWLLRKSQSAA